MGNTNSSPLRRCSSWKSMSYLEGDDTCESGLSPIKRKGLLGSTKRSRSTRNSMRLSQKRVTQDSLEHHKQILQAAERTSQADSMSKNHSSKNSLGLSVSSSSSSSTGSSFDAGRSASPSNSSSMLLKGASLKLLRQASSSSTTYLVAVPDLREVQEPHRLTPYQLDLIHSSWHAVISDSSNVCLNFFLDVHRMFPSVKKKISGQSNFITMSRSQPSSPFKKKTSLNTGTGGSTFHNSLVSSSKLSNNKIINNNDSVLAYHALKFTWAVDVLVGSLTEGHKGEVNKRTKILLEETGEELYQFFGICSLTIQQRQKMAQSFIQFLKLAITHSLHVKSGSHVAEWSDDVKTSWMIFFHILLAHLEDNDLDF